MKNKLIGIVAAALGLVAAALYFASMADYAFPGESASLIACWRGLDMLPKLAPHPLMAVFAKVSGTGNVLAPICGALSAWLLFLLVAAFVAWRVDSTFENRDPRETRGLALVADATATVVFVFTPAVRSAATHLEPRMFDFTWALAAFAVALPFRRAFGGIFWLFPPLLAMLVALGMCDSGLFLALLPFYLALVIGIAIYCGKSPFIATTFFVLALAVALPAAMAILGLDFSKSMLRSAEEIAGYFETHGWLVIAVFATVPFCAALFSSARAFDDDQRPIALLFHGAMTFASILAIATDLSPSSIMEPYAILPVATSAFTAATAGYLAAYWWMLASQKRVVGYAAGGLLAFVLVVSCLWRAFTFDGQAGSFADKIAEKVVEELGGRKWFVSDGTLDSHVQIVAAARGVEVNVVSLNRDMEEEYLEWLGKAVEESGIGGEKNSALKISLTLGVLPFVQDWLASDTNVANEVAIWGAPDLWRAAGMTPMPELLFFGADEARAPDIAAAWKDLEGILEVPRGWGSYRDRNVKNPLDRMRQSIRRHVGFVANNRGVWLQDKHRDDDAWRMYELVLNEIDRDNICTIFNEVAMVRGGHEFAANKQRDLERTLKAAVEDKGRRYILWRLGTYYGYIRDPEIFIKLGYAWAKSGRPGDALSHIRRAIDFVATDKRIALLNLMANLYADGSEQDKSRRIFTAILKRDAADHDALMGMMRLELQEGNSAKALDYLERAAAQTNDLRRAETENAMLSAMKGDFADAKRRLYGIVDKNPSDQRTWALLSGVVMQEIDAAGEDAKKSAQLKYELENDIIRNMEKEMVGGDDFYLNMTKGFLKLRSGEDTRVEARMSFEAAMKSHPDATVAQNLSLGLDISLDDRESAEEHAKAMLRRNRKIPLANYVLGSIALGNGKYDEAEAFLRRAADAPQPVSLAMNDLAETLRRRKNLKEAEIYARKAIRTDPNLYVAWETLGSILMDAGESLDEAEDCVRRACELSKQKDGRASDVRMLISLARVQIARRDFKRARLTMRKVQARSKELSDFEKQEFEEMRKSVR